MRFLIFRINRNHITVISVYVQNKVVVRMGVHAHWQSISYASSGSVVQTVLTKKTSLWLGKIHAMARIINKKSPSYRKFDVKIIT